MRAKEFIVEYKRYPVEEFHGVNFAMEEKNGQLIVRALDDWDNEMGHVVFNMDNDELDPQDLEVKEKFQRQGIARIMYDFVKSHGFTINRSWDQTPAGRGFWDKHRGEDVRVWESELDEIVRMPQGDFAGGKDTLQRDDPKEPSNVKPLPGNSQFVYNVEDRHGPLVINIYDPTSEDTWTPKAQLMVDDAGLQGLDNAVAVNMITVDEDYRGAGLARALYGIVLSILRRPLVAGDSQTPGGRRMWIMLDNIPGVVVRGLWAVQNDQLERPDVRALLKRPGLKVIGQGNYYTFVAFPIEHGKNEIKSLIRGLPLYHGEDPKYTTSMIATWHGQ